MSKKPGLYANIHAKRKRGEKMRKPGEEGAPSAQDFKDAAKTAKKKKGVKRQDPKGNPAGYYDKDGCKKCDGGKKPCRCGKADMGRKGPYADGCGYSKDSVAEEFNGILINDAERSDKPCGNSYIPEAAKCNKGRGTAKASKESLKKRALAKEREVNSPLRKMKNKELESRRNQIFEAQLKRFPKKKLTEENFKEFNSWREKQPDNKEYKEIMGEMNRRYKGRQRVSNVISGLGAVAAIGGAAVAGAEATNKLERGLRRRLAGRKLRANTRRGEKYLNLYKNKKNIPDPFA